MNQKRRKTIQVLEEAPIESEAGCMVLIVIIAIVATGIARLILEVFE